MLMAGKALPQSKGLGERGVLSKCLCRVMEQVIAKYGVAEEVVGCFGVVGDGVSI